ncbi:MAG: translation initiation factor IF-3 [Dehalococcoidia bacterium]|nr:translation initiation factor IF-3 [Dehalococcoidia bacterium]
MRVNQMIRAREVRVVDDEGKQLGIMPVPQALALAREQGLDLVEVAPTSQPPVCRIVDYGKLKYEQAKKERQAKKGQHLSQVREVKIRPKIGVHDLEAKLSNSKKMLAEGDKVRVVVVFRGREMAHQDRGWVLLQKVGEALKDVAVPDRPPQMEGNALAVIFAPAKHVKEAAKAPKKEALAEARKPADKPAEKPAEKPMEKTGVTV